MHIKYLKYLAFATTLKTQDYIIGLCPTACIYITHCPLEDTSCTYSAKTLVQIQVRFL